MKSRSPISALLKPSAIKVRTSSCRLVSPAGFSLVLGLRPRGIRRTPVSRNALRLSGANCQPASLVQQPRSIRVSTTDSHVAEYGERLYPGNRRHSITLQHKSCIISSTVPVALLEVRARASRDQVKFAEIQ